MVHGERRRDTKGAAGITPGAAVLLVEMPLKNYGVLKGQAIGRRLGSGQKPHYQVHLIDGRTSHRIAVNVRSQLAPSEVEYLVDAHFRHPLLDDLRELGPGFHPQPRKPGGLALDYIRGNLMNPRRMIPLPHDVPGPDNDLNEKVDHFIQRAMADEDAWVYAFGERWGPEEGKQDKYFGFQPGNGIHDIHMNQGNVGAFVKDDGVYQDGGLLLHFPGQQQWVAIFLKFQSQAWHTHDETGHRLPVDVVGPPSDGGETGGRIEPDEPPTFDRPDGLVRIVAALVNSAQSPERETVTLLNTSPTVIDLDGWAIADKQKTKQRLGGTLAPGKTLEVVVKTPVALSNKGGIITLLDRQGLKVDGVSYTKAQAQNVGWTVVF
jgi:uncharacterized protein YukJ